MATGSPSLHDPEGEAVGHNLQVGLGAVPSSLTGGDPVYDTARDAGYASGNPVPRAFVEVA